MPSLAKWSAAAMVLLAGFLLYRLSALQARVEALSRSVARLEAADPLANLPQLTPPVGAGAQVIVVGADGGVPRETLAALASARSVAPAEHAGALPGEADEHRRNQDEHILEVVERDREKVLDRHLEFHKERWMDSRATSLEQFGRQVNLSPLQHEKLDVLLRGEVDRMMDMLRQPRFRDHPRAFAAEWEATLNATDHDVQSILTASQREAWEEGRAIERAIFFPWLPQ